MSPEIARRGSLTRHLLPRQSGRVKSRGPSGSQDLALLAEPERRPPPFLVGVHPYHARLSATGRNSRQRISLDSAAFDLGACATGCHWLRPLCSMDAPSHVGCLDYAFRAGRRWRTLPIRREAGDDAMQSPMRRSPGHRTRPNDQLVVRGNRVSVVRADILESVGSFVSPDNAFDVYQRSTALSSRVIVSSSPVRAISARHVPEVTPGDRW